MEEIEQTYGDELFVVTGTCGTWQGAKAGGKVVKGLRGIMECAASCDYIKLTDEDGALHIKGHHHDGTNYFVARLLTDRGNAWYYKQDCCCNQYTCETLSGSNYYSKKVWYARDVYGHKPNRKKKTK